MYRFGSFVLDPAGRELRADGASVHLEPQAFDLLVYLVEHRDRVVAKSELLDGVWGHRFLSEASLTTRVKEVRRAIGDDGASQHSIRNVRGRGYRFVALLDGGEAGTRRPAAGGPGSSLIGRQSELGTIIELLDRSPVVTVLGTGGVGKSAVGRAVAVEVGGAHRDGAVIIELAALDAGAPVLPAVARALDVVVESDRPAEAIGSIAGLDVVLVLDNCEHVVDEVALVVDRMLTVAEPRLRILATSQVRLGVSAEAVVSIGPLGVADARALFVARAQAVLPSWNAEDLGPERIDGLLAELDRLPLTIEMAAARMGSMTFDDLEQAIAEGTPLLQMTHRAAARRHRSLGSIVDWSTRLLEPRLRDLFSGFSVFAGRVSAADAVAVLCPVDGSGGRFDLASLAERSLLVTDIEGPDTSYAMLSTVRAVAAGWLDQAGTADGLRRRHAEHLATALADVDDRLRTPYEADARRRLASLVDEARAAHGWARRHDPALASTMCAGLFHATYSSLWHEPTEWSQALLDGRAAAEVSALGGAVAVRAGAAAHRGDLGFAREQATAVATEATGRLRAIAVEVLADVALYEGDLDAASRWAEDLRRLGEELEDRHASAFAAVDTALALAYGGDPSGALEGLGRFDAEGLAPTDAAWLAYARGDALSLAHDPGAAAAFEEAIALGADVGNRLVICVSRTSLATEHARTGDVQRALEAYAHALGDFRRHGNHTHAVTAMRNLVGLFVAIGDDRGATVLAAAMADERLRKSYGTEADELSLVCERVRRRVGASRFTAWSDEGRALDLDAAVRAALELVDGHRA